MKNHALPGGKVRRALVILTAICFLPALAVAEETNPITPTARTLTDTDGRKIEVTILGKNGTSIKAQRTSDAKEFILPLAKLSDDDQKFIANLTAPTVKKPRALLIRTNDAGIRTALETRGFEIVRDRELIPPAKGSREIPLTTLTAAQIAEFDLIWVVSFKKDPEEIRECLADFKGVVAYKTSAPGISRSKVLKDEPPERGFVKSAYVKADDNFVFYHTADADRTGATRQEHPENVEKAADQLVVLMKKYHR